MSISRLPILSLILQMLAVLNGSEAVPWVFHFSGLPCAFSCKNTSVPLLSTPHVCFYTQENLTARCRSFLNFVSMFCASYFMHRKHRVHLSVNLTSNVFFLGCPIDGTLFFFLLNSGFFLWLIIQSISYLVLLLF